MCLRLLRALCGHVFRQSRAWAMIEASLGLLNTIMKGLATNWAMGPFTTPFNSTNACVIDTSIGSSLFPLYNITSLLFQLSTLKVNLFVFAYFFQFNTLTHWPSLCANVPTPRFCHNTWKVATCFVLLAVHF